MKLPKDKWDKLKMQIIEIRVSVSIFFSNFKIPNVEKFGFWIFRDFRLNNVKFDVTI